MANFDLDDVMTLKPNIFWLAIQGLPCILITASELNWLYCTNRHYWEKIVNDLDLHMLVYLQVLSFDVLLQIFCHCKVVSHHFSMRKNIWYNVIKIVENQQNFKSRSQERTLTLMTSWPWNLIYFDWLSKDYLVLWLQLDSSTGYYTNINNIEKNLSMTLTFIHSFFIKYYLLMSFYIYSAIVWWYPIIILWEKIYDITS